MKTVGCCYYLQQHGPVFTIPEYKTSNKLNKLAYLPQNAKHNSKQLHKLKETIIKFVFRLFPKFSLSKFAGHPLGARRVHCTRCRTSDVNGYSDKLLPPCRYCKMNCASRIYCGWEFDLCMVYFLIKSVTYSFLALI